MHTADPSAALPPSVPVTSPMQQQQHQQHQQQHPQSSPGKRRGRKADHGASGSEFANVDSRIATLEQAIGRMHTLARDQWGCRFLQAKLDESPVAASAVLDELFPHLVELMTDPFGNYLCQKLMERCSDVQRCAIIQKVSGEMVAISLSIRCENFP